MNDESHTKGYTTTGIVSLCGFFRFYRQKMILNCEVKEMVHINGEDVAADGKILKDYLLENGYTLTTIAVERNGEILPKAQYDTAVLNTDDVVEIVSFVGGG